MQKRAIIFDLDNTIYSVPSIGHTLFASLFKLIEEDGAHGAHMDKIKDDIMRRPFQLVAEDYQFSDALLKNSTALLHDLNFEGDIEPYPDYHFTKDLMIDKFLVTTGFKKLQHSKISALGIAGDFKEIHVLDPSESPRTKRDVFADVMERHGYKNSEVLVVGDDLLSEIEAAQDLHIEAILYEKDNRSGQASGVERIQNFSELVNFL